MLFLNKYNVTHLIITKSCLWLQLLILMIDSIMTLLIKANCCESINNQNYKLLFVFISSTKLWNSHCDGNNLRQQLSIRWQHISCSLTIQLNLHSYSVEFLWFGTFIALSVHISTKTNLMQLKCTRWKHI